MNLYEFNVKTNKRDELIPINSYVSQAIEQSGLKNGNVIVYCPHTTAAITINENADPTVRTDLIYALDHFFPDLKEYRHMEGNSRAHLKSSLIGVSEIIPFYDGKPVLGRWQDVYFCEFDGPRLRKVYVEVQEA